jgi:hypothetical protein
MEVSLGGGGFAVAGAGMAGFGHFLLAATGLQVDACIA